MRQYVTELHQYLAAFGNAEIAEKQSAYMRNRFPFFGLMKTDLEYKWKEFQSFNGKIISENAVSFAKECIVHSEREMWYIGLKTMIKFKKKLQASDLEFIKILIINSDWWDIVDNAASHLVGAVSMQYPDKKKDVNSWIESDNFWLRRTALIYQLGYKKNTDEKMLYSHILKTCHEKEFFIRKAIGWALREYSKHQPESVRNFIEENREKLSNLSIKEGSKYI